jgi:two-component system, NarL family, nitrate/nitrite response regulator NarL
MPWTHQQRDQPALELSEKTTKSHITAIFKALGVVNRTQAAAAARRSGIVTY